MSSTLGNLIDDCEADLADSANAVWSAADIQRWCEDAIVDYSQHFPLIASQTINCSAGDRTYDLASTFKAMISVEYPAGQEPPLYLQPRPYLGHGFWQAGIYYDVIDRGDDTEPAELWLSAAPAAGESIAVTFQSHHPIPATTATLLTVPDEHLPLLRAYVRWQALVQLQAVEEANPTSNSSLLMSQLAINSDRARRAYVDGLARALYANAKSVIVSWLDLAETTGRIY